VTLFYETKLLLLLLYVVCDLEASIMEKPRPTRAVEPFKKKIIYNLLLALRSSKAFDLLYKGC
jgi:hypothetical protein